MAVGFLYLLGLRRIVLGCSPAMYQWWPESPLHCEEGMSLQLEVSVY